MINILIIGVSRQFKHELEAVGMQVSFFTDEVLALNSVEKIQPAVIVLNYSVQKSETANYLKQLLKIGCKSKVVVVADGLNDEAILACLSAGAKGYININQLDKYFIKMVKVINRGETWVSRHLVAKLLNGLVCTQVD